MRCEVLLFAGLADAAGTRRLNIELADGSRVIDMLQRLDDDHESLRAFRQRLAVAVNERYVDGSTVLSDGDVVALIPPVSGG